MADPQPRQYCGAVNPKAERPGASCVLRKDHRTISHQDMAGNRWSDRPVSTCYCATDPDACTVHR